MFFENFLAFCVKTGESPTSVVTKIGLNKSAVTSWRKGTNPTNTTLLKLANYFNITVEELTGKKEPAPTRVSESDTKPDWLIKFEELSPGAQKEVIAFIEFKRGQE